MTEYAVGSVASALSQKSAPAAEAEPKKKSKKKPAEPQKNQEVLNQLFSVANVSTPIIVSNVPIPVAPVKKLKRNKRHTDQYMIHSSNPKKSRKGMTASELDDEVAEEVFDPEIDQDPYDNEEAVIPSEKVARQMKKQEIKNIKKKAAEKGTLKEGDDKVVIVKNLPINVKRRSIQNFFSKYGPIESVWLRCAALVDPAMPKKVAVIKKQFHPDRQSITGFVRFQEVESAQQAVAATGTLFQQQHIAVNLLTDSTKERNGTSIFVGNLAFGIEDEALWTHFGQCGTIRDVRIIRDSTNGLGKGFGYVNFDSTDAVELALRLNESDLNGRSLRVTRCQKNPKTKAAPVPAKDKTKGAYKRVQEKQMKQDRSKSSGWISKMKQRQKQSQHQQGGQVQSFAGETTSTNNKVVKAGKMIKKNKEEQRKKVIAAKLAK